MRIKSEKARTLLKWFMGLTVIALAATIYLVYLHYENPLNAPCNINAYFNCDIVNKSKFSEILGIPVAILGLFNYIFLLLVSWGLIKGFNFGRINKNLKARNVIWFLFGVVTSGLVFSLYLTYAELFIIQAVCIFCITQQVIILADFVILWRVLMIK